MEQGNRTETQKTRRKIGKIKGKQFDLKSVSVSFQNCFALLRISKHTKTIPKQISN